MKIFVQLFQICDNSFIRKDNGKLILCTLVRRLKRNYRFNLMHSCNSFNHISHILIDNLSFKSFFLDVEFHPCLSFTFTYEIVSLIKIVASYSPPEISFELETRFLIGPVNHEYKNLKFAETAFEHKLINQIPKLAKLVCQNSQSRNIVSILF